MAGWGICILLALAGWGRVLADLISPSRKSPWGQRCAWGMSAAVALGGLLNIAQLISPTTLGGFIAIGLLLEASALRRGVHNLAGWLPRLRATARRDPLLVLGWSLVCLLAGVCYLGAVSTSFFNEHDDWQGYFVFPAKMLQTGSLGPDPFSERRLVASLGGQPFLQAFVLGCGSFANLHLLDAGICMLVLSGMLVELATRFGMGRRMRWLVPLLFLLVPLPRANTTSVLSGAVLLLGMNRMLLEPGLPARSLPVVGLMTGAICALKSTLVPPAILCLLLYLGIRVFRSSNRRSELAWAGAALVLLLAVLWPWMVSMHASSGTYLYPLLGQGYHGSSYGSFAPPDVDLSWFSALYVLLVQGTEMPILVLLALAALYWVALREDESRAAVLAIIASAAAGTIIVTLAVLGAGGLRYSMPFLLPAILLLVCKLAAVSRNAHPAARLPVAHVTLVVCALWLGSSWDVTRLVYRNLAVAAVEGWRGAHAVATGEREQARDMQRAIPQSAVVLARVTKPFLFDFSQQRIYIIDYPGGASPPPGMPSFQGEEKLAEYLRAQGVNYIAYFYRDEAGFTREQFGDRLDENQHAWIRSQAAFTFDFQENLARLGRSRRRIYDDGSIWVIDLAEPSAHPRSS